MEHLTGAQILYTHTHKKKYQAFAKDVVTARNRKREERNGYAATLEAK